VFSVSKYLCFKYYLPDIQRSTELEDPTCNEVDTKERSLSPPFSGHSDERKTLHQFPLILRSGGTEWPARSNCGESVLLSAKQGEVFLRPKL
jgi:hypothetical protein